MKTETFISVLIVSAAVGILIIILCILFPSLLISERSADAWQACINAGGVPIQSWYNESILSDCKFPQIQIKTEPK